MTALSNTSRPVGLLLSLFSKQRNIMLSPPPPRSRYYSSFLRIRNFPKSSRITEINRCISLSCRSIVNQNQPNLHKEIKELAAETDLNQTEPYVIYEGGLTKQLKHVKIFSLMTSGMGLIMQPAIFNAPDTPLAATVAVLGMVGFFTYVTPLLIHQLAKKYVTEIIYDPQKELYTASTYSFFLQKRETVFSKNDVTVPDAPGPLTTVLVGSKDAKQTGLFIALESFIFPVHYGKMMGYDKPLDLHLTVEDVEAVVKVNEQKNKKAFKEK